MQRLSLILASVAFGLGGLVAAATLRPDQSINRVTTPSEIKPLWREVTWPLPMDQWGKGKAFRCRAADCGAEVNVYIRAKIGFCNCATGVSDDDELQRISDLELFDSTLVPLTPGRPISIAWMKGRSRPFSTERQARQTKSALSVGFNDRCDAIIATAVVDRPDPIAIEPAVIDFLNSRTVIRWAEVTLGL